MNPQWIALTYVLVDDEDETFVRMVEKYAMKEKQPWIVAVYQLLERQMFC